MYAFEANFWYLPLAILVIFWTLNRLLVPKLLPGIPHSYLANWSPCGSMLGLGINMLQFGSDFDWICRQCLQHNSPICQVTVPPFSTISPVVLIADLRIVKEIAAKRLQEFDRASLVHVWFSTIFPKASTSMTSTPAFRQQRRIWNCLLNRDFLDNITTLVIESTIQQYIKLWTIKANVTNDSFAAYEDFRRLTLEVMWKILLGTDLGLADASISWCLEKKSTNTAKATSKSFPHLFGDFMTQITALLWVVTGISTRMYKFLLPLLPPFRLAVQRTHDTLNSLISDTRQRLNSGIPTTRCGLSEVLQLNDNIPPDDVLVDEIVELLMTGHETSATTMAWGFKFLADYQEVQERLYTALKCIWPDGMPNSLQISQAKIPYLDAVLAEILRLACTAPVAFRETMTDCEVLGHHIPAHTPVFLVTQSALGKYGMITPNSFSAEKEHDSKTDGMDFCSFFERFIPERWLDSKGIFNPDAGLSLPFSAGKRGCFGKRIAMLELKLAITMFVLSFHFEQLPKNRSRYSSHDTLTRQPACCYIKPVPR